MNDPSDDTLRQWLLRRLPAKRTDTLERSLFEDDAFAERLREAENDLFDDAARDRLGADERAAFDAYFRDTADDRARFEFAQATARLQAERASGTVVRTRRRRRPWLAVAAALVAAVALGALVRFGFAPDNEPGRASVPTLTLRMATLRGSAADEIVLALAGDATLLRLQVEIDTPTAKSCDVQVIRTDGQVAFRAAALDVRRIASYSYVEAMVPVASLAPGPLQFALRCDGSERRTWAVRIAPVAV